jgi:hypothetical protein
LDVGQDELRILPSDGSHVTLTYPFIFMNAVSFFVVVNLLKDIRQIVFSTEMVMSKQEGGISEIRFIEISEQ